MVRVALVGYTNAGKSTLMNALSGADVLTEDLLFATLDATTRKIELPGGHGALLTDTVGLIKKLPHHLVVSFHATLEEVADADLLLHVVDVSKPHCERYMDLANGVLKDMGIEERPTRLVFNKVDLAGDDGGLERLRRVYPGALFTSAVGGDGLEEVRRAVCAFVESLEEVLDVAVPYSDGRLISSVYEMGEVLSKTDGEEALEMRVRVSARDADRLRKLGVVVDRTESAPGEAREDEAKSGS
jgi:GTP-binding protein HflX